MFVLGGQDAGANSGNISNKLSSSLPSSSIAVIDMLAVKGMGISSGRTPSSIDRRRVAALARCDESILSSMFLKDVDSTAAGAVVTLSRVGGCTVVCCCVLIRKPESYLMSGASHDFVKKI